MLKFRVDRCITGISYKATVDRLNLISRRSFRSNEREIALQALIRFVKLLHITQI